MTDPNFNQDYKEPVAPAGGLTREMKMLLGALMILLMAGGLTYYFSSLGTPATETEVQGDSTTVTTTSSTTTSSSATVAAVDGDVTTASGAATEIPPLVPTASGTATTTKELGGINPAAPLAAVPARNPFKPLKVTADDATATNGVSTSGGTVPASSFPEPSVNVSAPSDFTPNVTSSASYPTADMSSSDSSSGSSWSIEADTSTSTSGGSDSTTKWVLGSDDTPVAITSGSSAGGSKTTGTTAPTTTTGSSGSSVSGSGSTGSGSTSGNLEPWAFGDSGSDSSTGAGGRSRATGDASSAASQTPPVAGVSEPSLGTIASRPAHTSMPTATSTGNGTGTTGAVPSTSVPLPTPSQPELITQYGSNQGIGAPDDGTALSRTLNRRNVRFTGAVLGPNDTAIFKDNSGFMVLGKGDRLPDTDIRVHEITARSVTLALGKESLTLELEPLQQTANASANANSNGN